MVLGLLVNFGSGVVGFFVILQVCGVIFWKDDDGENSESNGLLVIIDGVLGNMFYFNFEDIKLIFVLKDVVIVVIYGLCLVVGVILIEIYCGMMNLVLKIIFFGYWGLSVMLKCLEVCNLVEFIKVCKMVLINVGMDESCWFKYISEYERDLSQFVDIDWQKEYY